MDSKQIRKSVGRFFGWLGLNLCSLIIKIIPRCLLYRAAGWLAAISYRLAGKQRKIALESLSIAFGKEKTPAELTHIAKDCFTFMAKSGFEVLFFIDRPNLLKKQIEITGRDNLDSALAEGRGVILVSAHFGNFPLMLAKLSLEGYKTSGIMRYMRDERTEKFFLVRRIRLGIKTIYTQPRKVCVENSLRVLRNNELLFFLLDQNFGTAGVFVDFFGRKAATATGPVILAKRTQAKILPCFIIRQKDDTLKIIFEPALELERGNNGEKAVVNNVQRITNIIESYIRKYPAEWSWIHRRWKSRSVR